MKFDLTNVRSFYGAHHVSLRKLNLFVGENSSGKTTLLAMINACLQSDFPAGKNIFNTPPFELGSFETIASFRGGRSGRAGTFSLGGSARTSDGDIAYESTFSDLQGAPALCHLKLTGPEVVFEVNITGDRIKGNFGVIAADIRFSFDQEYVRPLISSWSAFTEIVLSAILATDKSEDQGKGRLQAARMVFSLMNDFQLGRASVKALAPLRTKPKRTYDETSDEFTPEGNHIPRVMANMVRSGHPARNSENFFASLNSFGKASGLFSSIEVKQLGSKSGDPFQVRIKTAGPLVNLVDVGYGVSQTLPVIADVLLSPPDEVILIQQPEVHLHPRAQAALGSFFASRAAIGTAPLCIETHSDYLIDRVRLEVTRGTIGHADVALFFLDRKGSDSTIHELSIDQLGNIQDAPPSYRRFFLEEEDRLLTRSASYVPNS